MYRINIIISDKIHRSRVSTSTRLIGIPQKFGLTKQMAELLSHACARALSKDGVRILVSKATEL
jgi:hypothetical protein